MWVRPLSLFLLGLETLHVLGWGLLLLLSYSVGSDWAAHWVILHEIATSSTHAQSLAFILQVLAYPVALARNAPARLGRSRRLSGLDRQLCRLDHDGQRAVLCAFVQRHDARL